jgi:2-C-methyl-D-erythritol 4-phosphate cytidylyltransferase
MRVAALIVAAGRGTRMGGDTAKQYLDLDGRTILFHTLEKFLSHAAVHLVLPVIHADDDVLYSIAIKGLDQKRLAKPVIGGASRAASVRNGLDALDQMANRPDLVLIHDAARPFVTDTTITNCIEGLAENTQGVCAAVPVVDAMWREGEGGMVGEPVSRDGVWRAQTPQGFHFDAILNAHRRYQGAGVDDVDVARHAGIGVTLIESTEGNYKITTSADLERARKDIKRI